MAYVFKNQPTATATITKYGSDTTVKIAGINGEQSNANNFQTAITDFVGIAGLTVGEAQRTINQSVEEHSANFTVTPTRVTGAFSPQSLYNDSTQQTANYAAFQVSYNGELRSITATGYVGRGWETSAISFTSNGTKYCGFFWNNKEWGDPGADPQEYTLTLTLAAGDGYDAESVNVTLAIGEVNVTQIA